MNGTIWGGSRVRVVSSPDPSILVGAEGVNLGRRKGQPGAVTLVIRLEDGREVRLPLSAVEKIEAQYVHDALAWKNDMPLRRTRRVEEARSGDLIYAVEGSAGRWYVTRRNAAGGQVQRTKYFRNQRLAHQAFMALAYGIH